MDDGPRRTPEFGSLVDMIDAPGDGPPSLRDHPFTTGEALDAGLTHYQLGRAVDAGWLRRPFPGVYVPAPLPDDLRTRMQTLGLCVPDDAFVCDHSAAWLLAGDRALVPGDHLVIPEVSYFRPTAAGRLRREHVRSGEREIRDDEVVDLGPLRVTTPLRTALDIGRLSRNNDIRLHGMDTMLSLGSFTRDELVDAAQRFKGYRGVVGLRALAPLADGGSESFGESALRLRWHQAHLPWPTTQHPVEGTPYVLDIALPEELLDTEYDGERFHSTPEQTAHDAARRRGLSRLGWVHEVFRKEHVFGPRQSVEQRLRSTYAAVVAGRKSRTYF